MALERLQRSVPICLCFRFRLDPRWNALLDSCFVLREPHILLHINTCTTEDKMAEAAEWPEGIVRKLKEAGEVLPEGYVNFMGLDERTDGCFGENWERLKAVKKNVDPKNVFRFAQPMIPVDDSGEEDQTSDSMSISIGNK